MTTETVRCEAVVPVVPVADFHAAAKFYEEQLGFPLQFEQGPYGGVKRGDAELHLHGVGADALTGPVTVRVHVSGAQQLYAELEPKGVIDPEEPLNTKPWGATQFSVLDPDSNRLTFVQFS
jgi:uncharacterized glyoxalase superfamily protein PhnB